MRSHNSFNTLNEFNVDDVTYQYFDLTRLMDCSSIKRLPYCLRVILENLLRHEDGRQVTKQHIQSLVEWSGKNTEKNQISFTPSRVVLQDFTGVPSVVDLAAMRDAITELGGKAEDINPRQSVDLVIDHSVMVDYYGDNKALSRNTQREFERNEERYQFLRWGQSAFHNFRVVPPGRGIVHQVNLEYLAHVVTKEEHDKSMVVYPDTLVGTDSHTTMINGLGVLGWGVGGIEAEAAMLGQAISMIVPEVVGVRLTGALPEGATATDLVLRITELLREKGVVGKFVEFFGDGLNNLPLADRATIANMAPEYGATCGIFPIDKETISYLTFSGREEHQVKLVESYAKAQNLWRDDQTPDADYNDIVELDLCSIAPCIAGPKRPQDRIALKNAPSAFNIFLQSQERDGKDRALLRFTDEGGDAAIGTNQVNEDSGIDFKGERFNLKDGDIVIAAITSCTNTSNPSVMIAAGLMAKKAVALGLKPKPWVKTSLAPGSQVVPAYLEKADLMSDLNTLGFHVVGFGCTTCIGNSGPLPDEILAAIKQKNLNVCSVLSGNRNFEGRIHADVKANFLASPPLVLAYALAGTMNVNLSEDVLGHSHSGEAVYLRDIWPSQKEIGDVISTTISAELYKTHYQNIFDGTDEWQKLSAPFGKNYEWPESTYVKKPPYFAGMSLNKPEPTTIHHARCLVKLGDSVTTDHISPAGSIHPESPAGKYLIEQGVEPFHFNSIGSRRGNHELMVRATFANPRLRNQLVPGTEGGFTTYFPKAELTTIFDAAERYRETETPLIVLAGKEYGTGSSRDWAAKGVNLLGIKVVIAESFERIHRSNLVGFGVLPLQYQPNENAETLALTGEEDFSFSSINEGQNEVLVSAKRTSGELVTFTTTIRIDTPQEWDYYQHGGILHYVLRQFAQSTQAA